MHQQRRGDGLVVTYTRRLRQDIGRLSRGEGLQKAIRGRTGLPVGGVKRGDLDGRGEVVIYLQRRNVGVHEVEVAGDEVVVDRGGGGGRREQRLHLERRGIQTRLGDDVVGETGRGPPGRLRFAGCRDRRFRCPRSDGPADRSAARRPASSCGFSAALKVAIAERVGRYCGLRIDGQRLGAELLKTEEEERLVMAVVQLGNPDRAAESEADNRCGAESCARAGRLSAEFVKPASVKGKPAFKASFCKVVEGAAVILVGARLHRVVEVAAARLPVFGREIAGLDRDFLDRVRRPPG